MVVAPGATVEATSSEVTADIAVACVSHSPQMAEDTEGRQGLVFRAGMARLARAIAEYRPTLVVIFAPDHLRALTGMAPCFTVVSSAEGWGDWNTPVGDYDVPSERAEALAAWCADAGIDIALAGHLRIDHGVGQPMTDLFGGLAAVPVIPVIVNCVGVPLATIPRVAALGRAVGAFLRREIAPDERVLVLGSGGLSHAPPSLVPGAEKLSEEQRQAIIHDNLVAAARAIAPDWDAGILRSLAAGDWDTLAGLTADQLAAGGTGGAEVRTWLAAAFAGGVPLQTVTYQPVDEWITGMGIAAARTLADLGATPAPAEAVRS